MPQDDNPRDDKPTRIVDMTGGHLKQGTGGLNIVPANTDTPARKAHEPSSPSWPSTNENTRIERSNFAEHFQEDTDDWTGMGIIGGVRRPKPRIVDVTEECAHAERR